MLDKRRKNRHQINVKTTSFDGSKFKLGSHWSGIPCELERKYLFLSQTNKLPKHQFVVELPKAKIIMHKLALKYDFVGFINPAWHYCSKAFIFFIVIHASSCMAKSFYDVEMEPVITEIKAKNNIAEKEPISIDLKLNNSTVLGVDINSNGVRDDFELWANHKIRDHFVRNFFKQVAFYDREMQRETLAKNREKVRSLYLRLNTIYMCKNKVQYSVSEFDRVQDIFLKMWLNTQPRKNLEKITGLFVVGPTGIVDEKICEQTLKNIEKRL